MNCLVTGGSGFIGSNLALASQKKGYKVVVLDDWSKEQFANLSGFNGDIIIDDITTIDLDRFKEIDVIFHCAAITDTTLRDKRLMTRVNVNGFKRFLKFAITNNKKFIYSSSAAVYGQTQSSISEHIAGRPLNLYGKSKWTADCIAMKYINKNMVGTGNANIVGLRYFNVFGRGEQFKGKMASMVWQLVHQMAEGKQPRIFKWGEQKRDYVYIKDVVNANILALKAKKSAIVNIGTGRAISFNYIIKTLNKMLGTTLEPEYFDNPYLGTYQNYTQADLTLAKEVLGYSPEWTFEDALWDYFRSLGI